MREHLLLFLIRNSLRDEPLSPPVRKGSVACPEQGVLGEVHPMKRNDMQKRGKRMEEMTGMWKIPMKEGKTAHGNTGYNF